MILTNHHSAAIAIRDPPLWVKGHSAADNDLMPPAGKILGAPTGENRNPGRVWPIAQCQYKDPQISKPFVSMTPGSAL